MKLPAGWYIFYYHDVSNDSRVPSSIRTAPERFASEIGFLKRNFDLAAFSEGLRALRAGTIDRPIASVCFDDGFSGVLRHELPILERERVPHILFLNGAFLDGDAVADAVIARQVGKDGNSLRPLMHPEQYPVLWAGVRERFEWSDVHISWPSLTAFPSDLTQFGNHSRNHYWLAGLPFGVQEEEIASNDALLRKLPGYQSLLALPFGTSDCFDEATLAVNDAVHGDVVIKAVGGINHRLENGRWYLERMGMSDDKPRIDDIIRERVTGRDFGYRSRKLLRKFQRVAGLLN